MVAWVVIEAGAKQRFIFGTNKRRANVGASQLVADTATWVHWAIDECRRHGHDGVDPVVVDSGVANLLVPSADVGHCLIAQVTAEVLDRAPGLDVWGVTHEVDDCDDPMASLGPAQAALSAARAGRATPLVRSPVLPVTQTCGYTGGPASVPIRDTGLAGKGSQPTWVSRDFAAAYRAGAPVDGQGAESASRQRLVSYVPWRVMKDAGTVVGPEDVLAATDQEFSTWVGVVHADGDGMGSLFTAIRDGGQLEDLRRASSRTRDLAEHAVRAAVLDTHATAVARGVEAGWLLPLIVGGDDVTALVDGRVAVDFAVNYCRRFDQAFDSAEFADLREVIADRREVDPTVPERLSVSAGVAIVKPHHPFSDAIELAEQLCGSAKREPGSTVDFHVLFDSVGSSLAGVRAPLLVSDPKGRRLQLWGGPYTAADCRCDLAKCPSIRHLYQATEAMSATTDGRPQIGGTVAHRLRDAMTSGGARIARASEQAKLRTDPTVWAEISAHLILPTEDAEVVRSRWLDAVALSDVQEVAP